MSLELRNLKKIISLLAKLPNDYEELRQLAKTALDLYRSAICIHGCAVVDFLQEKVKNTDDSLRAVKLHQFLSTVDANAADLVLIERQPAHLGRWGGATSGAVEVASWLIFYYSTRGKPCKYISAKEKTKVAFCGDAFADSAGSESRRKAERKQYTVKNFSAILSAFPHPQIDIPASQLNHVADACMQGVAYARKNSPM